MKSHKAQPKEEIIEHLENIAKASCDLNLSKDAEAALWNAIEILEVLIEDNNPHE